MTNYLKLVDQRFIEPIRTLRQVQTSIMGILKTIDFEVIDLVDGISAYLTLVGQHWGHRMKATISLKKDRIKLKGNNEKIIIPLDTQEGKTWVEPYDE